MKNNDLYKFVNRVDQLKDLSGVKFSYCMIKNKKAFIKEISILEESKKASEKFSEFDKKRVDLIKKNSKKDKKGNPEIVNSIISPEESKKEKVYKQIETLSNEYKKEIDEHSKKIQEFNELLEKEISIDIHYLDYADLPINITVTQLDIVYGLIKEQPKK